ncbi:MAG: leucine--tRNA ligase [Thermotogae bacterium]|nr:leucine--tRNA ligase [Thermotogota bacterium]
MEREYNPQEVEKRWQKFWEEIELYRTPEPPKRKYYVLEMFPYPSGKDLHMGHLKNYAIGDAVARAKMMEGYDILHPMGWDSFGLPAENAAIKYGVHPREWTYKNIEGFRSQLKMMGISYDWDREFATSDPEYYRWTQRLFLLLYERGLAYRKGGWVNWCPKCKTVLANEQVIDGRCERCKTPVIKKKLTQWYFKITDYAERLLKDLEKLEGRWPESVIKQQRNWIGRSEGVEIVFMEGDLPIRVFTTRADTLFGVTFISVAPDSQIAEELLKRVSSEVAHSIEEYAANSLNRSVQERTQSKTGIFTGLYARHPFTGESIPIFVADYVLGEYGTGAVMGVPAHDQRDYEFARRFNLPIKVVVYPDSEEALREFIELSCDETENEEFAFEYKGRRYVCRLKGAYERKGILKNSGEFTGLKSDEAIDRIAQRLKEMDLGGPAVSYRLRDWLVSRQRYWGAPIPMIHCERCGVVPENELPVLLPEVEKFQPEGRSPLENVPEFINTTCPKCGGPAKRDPDTMDTFVDSSWYFLRFTDPHNDHEMFSPEKANRWMPVDQYIGGAEHATKHLIYARFITKVLYDAGLLKYDEPFSNLFTQGLVLMGFWWCKECNRRIAEEDLYDVKVVGTQKVGYHDTPEGPHEVIWLVEMMSKSRGNVVPLGPFVREYGADAARIAILFAAPPEQDFEWTDAIKRAAVNFLNRVWRTFYTLKEAGVSPTLQPDLSKDKELLLLANDSIKGIREDLNRFKFNTAISKLMVLLGEFKPSKYSRHNLGWVSQVFVRLLAPFAPHLSEELFHEMGMDELFGEKTVFQVGLPKALEGLEAEEVSIGVQINGKTRGSLIVPKDASQEEVLDLLRSHPKLAKYINGKELKRVIYVPGRLINVIVT